MSAYIYDLATAVPATFEPQKTLRDLMKSTVANDRKTRTIVHQMYTHSGIEKRHIAHAHNFYNNEHSFFHRVLDEQNPPRTEERNTIYKKEATILFVEVAQQLLSQNPHIDKHEITHIITVSCTGFFAPGPDFELVRHLGLSPATQRYHLGFMGCYASVPALKMAKAFVDADPNALVLVISCELCTLHFQAEKTLDNLIAGSVFADGAAGALVGSKPPATSGFEMLAFTSDLAYEGEKDMAWSIGNFGFNLRLSSYVPDIIGGNIAHIMAPIFNTMRITAQEISTWAIHPGGRAIIDKMEKSMKLTPAQVRPSRTVLANFGNMSSATILFVLAEVRRSGIASGSNVLPIAFGPGLTIETGLLRYLES